jgi:hypothetical protein
MAVLEAKTPLTGLARTLVASGLLNEGAARQAVLQSAKEKVALVPFLIGHKLASGRDVASAAIGGIRRAPLGSRGLRSGSRDQQEGSGQPHQKEPCYPAFQTRQSPVHRGFRPDQPEWARRDQVSYGSQYRGQAFEIVGRGHENKGMQDLILSVKSDVEAGGALADGLRKHPAHFNELYVNLVTAGEASGILEAILHKLATYLEKIEALKSKIKSALFYPTAVIVVAFIITAILMIFVIPQFEQLFSGFGADLPPLTRLVITISQYFQEYWWLIFGTLIGSVAGILKAKKRSVAVAHFFDRMLLKRPVLGGIIEKAAIARFSRTLATMFAAGTPLLEAMNSVAGACGNIIFHDATLKMRDEISTGSQLQAAMRDTGIFPNWWCRWSPSVRNPGRSMRCWARSPTGTSRRSMMPWIRSPACSNPSSWRCSGSSSAVW